MDYSPKLFALSRGDVAIAFGGGTDWAYPAFLQLAVSVDAHGPSRDRAVDLPSFKRHVLHVLDRIAEGVSSPIADMAMPNVEFLLGGYAHAGRQGFLHPHPYYVRPNEEAFDDIVNEINDLVVIQCKGAFLPIEARYSGRCEPFLAGLNKRFGFDAGAACDQLLRNLEFTFGIKAERRKMRGIEIGSVRNVYPLAIVQEPLLGFWLAAKLLFEEFVSRAARILWKLDVRVAPSSS